MTDCVLFGSFDLKDVLYLTPIGYERVRVALE